YFQSRLPDDWEIPGGEVVDEQVATHRDLESGLSSFLAQAVGVEDHCCRFSWSSLDLNSHLTLDEQKETGVQETGKGGGSLFRVNTSEKVWCGKDSRPLVFPASIGGMTWRAASETRRASSTRSLGSSPSRSTIRSPIMPGCSR